MKNSLELNSLGVKELSQTELSEVNGGWWQAALAIAGAVIYIYNEGDDLIDGIKEGYAAYQGQQNHAQ